MVPLLIRPAAPQDCPTLTDIVRTSSAYDGDYRVMVAEIVITPSQLTQDHVFVAEQADNLLGFYSLKEHSGSIELDFMFTADVAQGQGVGRHLFSHLIEKATQLGYSAIDIVAHPPAEAFYARMGAIKVGDLAPLGRIHWSRPQMRYFIS